MSLTIGLLISVEQTHDGNPLLAFHHELCWLLDHILTATDPLSEQ